MRRAVIEEALLSSFARVVNTAADVLATLDVQPSPAWMRYSVYNHIFFPNVTRLSWAAPYFLVLLGLQILGNFLRKNIACVGVSRM